MTHVENLSKDLTKLLNKYPSLQYNEERKRIQCSLSGHEMPCSLEAVKAYLDGKKFAKLQAREDTNFDKFMPHLVPSTSGPKKVQQSQLFCTLTLRHINKTEEHVRRHIEGARYRRALKKWEECQKNGTEFRAPGWQRMKSNKNKEDDSAGTDEDEGEISDADSLSDLYPAKVMKEAAAEDDGDEVEDTGDSDFDPNEMDVEESTPVKVPSAENGASSKKHKAKKEFTQTKKKQQKKKKQKIG